jgi:two-component system LytT family sensor kinase
MRDGTTRVDGDALPTARVIVVGCALAVFLALTVSGQLYLSMIHHGHSFARLFSAELARWLYWPFAAPIVLRLGSRLMGAGGGIDRHQLGRAAALGLAVIGLHVFFSVPFVLYLRPLWPMTPDGDWFVVAQSQLPTWIPTDLLLFVLLLIGGNTYAVYQRARRVELREARLETELARAQLDALSLEIQPHFLFNTLNSIAALIRLQDNSGALKMLLGLSDLMRMTVDRPQDHLVPLATEIDFLQRYVDLQQTRFADRLRVDYRIEEECRSLAVPTFLLQPLVENAIRHGASPQARACRIEVGARCDAGLMRLWVSDDGAGLPGGFELERNAGTGLKNTQSRLRQIFGPAATFDVRRGEREGTIIEMTFPSSAHRSALRQPA